MNWALGTSLRERRRVGGNRDPIVRREETGLSPEFALVLKGKRGIIMDRVDASLLANILEQESISSAAGTVGISYRNAWDRLERLQNHLKRKLVLTRSGGKTGGGASLTDEGKALVGEYRRLNNYLFDSLGDRDFWSHVSYRLSARNRLKARVVSVKRGEITSEIKLRTTEPGILTSVITNEGVDYLDLRTNDEVEAIVKATEVLVAKPELK